MTNRLNLLNKQFEANTTGWIIKNVEHYDFESMGSLKGKTIFITGASRGIGLAIALRAAKDGANVAIAAKTVKPQPNLPGTIYTAADEIRAAGGKALACVCDIRDEKSVEKAVADTVKEFGGIDICINNASAIYQTPVESTSTKKFDLAMAINTRGTFVVSKACIPHLKNEKNPHILTISPPLNFAGSEVNWFARIGTGYVLAKYGMTLITHGLAKELEDYNIGCNCLWPRTAVATAAVMNHLGGQTVMDKSRTTEIMADAAHVILTSNAEKTND